MANIRNGSIVSDIRGRVGTEVYSRNRGGAYAKTYSGVGAPNSGGTLSWRNVFADLMDVWRVTLDDDERLKWNTAAEIAYEKGVFERKRLTGREYFFKRSMHSYAAFGIIGSPYPLVEEVGTLSNIQLTNTTNTLVVSGDAVSGVSTPRVVIGISDVFSNTTFSFNSTTGLVYQYQSISGGVFSQDMFSSWSTRYGRASVPSGMAVFVKVWITSIFVGTNSPPLIHRFITS